MKKNVCFRAIALLLLVTLGAEIFYPPLLFALTSGPTQMEFAGVGPGTSSEMVNPFTGDFSYNLPLLTVPGPHGSSYPVTLNYNSNMSPEEDASWVGYGWTLSPGAITRSRNGFADDLDGTRVTYYNKSVPNITLTAGSYKAKENGDVEINNLATSKFLRYNNYSGWSTGRGFFASVMGVGSLGINSGDDGLSFSASLNPLNALQKLTGLKIPVPKQYLPPIPAMSKNWDINPSNLHPTKSVHTHGEMARIAWGEHKTETKVKGESETYSGSYLRVETFPQESKTCYGYMYTKNARAADIMDYGVEKEKAFHLKRNKFLSIPFSSPDDFIATGSGVGGKFRLYHNKVGTFRPATQQSFLPIENTYVERVVPKEMNPDKTSGWSGELENGENTLTIDQWFTPDSQYFTFRQNDGLQDEPYYFRFDGDRGGSSIYHRDTDKPTQAGGDGKYDRRTLPAVMNGGDRQGRTSYIGFHTMEDLTRKGGNNIPYLAYDKDHSAGSASTFVDRSDNNAMFQKSIGEFALVGSNGSKYTYGLPVYTREETDLAFGVPPTTIEHNFLVRERSDSKKLGEYRPDPYASTYLLTEVTTPNYVDINNNGADDEDLGGYTKFQYHRAYGSNNKREKNIEDPSWYKWRIPYKGLRYEQNSISESRDDIARVNAGEKEVYYMRSIETKTHVAYFVTNRTDFTVNGLNIKGSQTMRLDGCQANPDENAAVQGSAYPPENFDNKLEYLEEIRLYAKDENGNPDKLLKTTHFVYDYSLMAQRTTGNNDLNSFEKAGTGKRVGKLTLKYVWFESENVVNPLISPYEFVYQYPTSSLDAKYTDIYPDAIKPPTYTDADAAENPEYSVFNIDGWGNYQKDGGSRYEDLLTWVNQKPSSQFDPAAWHLKIIRFPSGGELHVQYEQHDYAYVQNRPAMVMAPLLSESVDDDLLIVNQETDIAGEINVLETVISRNKFYLDLDAVFGSLAAGQRTALVKQIKRYFIDAGKQREKMHFRFRYILPGILRPFGIDDSPEDIAGYASVSDCGEENGKVFIRLSQSSFTGIIAGDQPRYAAYRYHKTHERKLPLDFSLADNPEVIVANMQDKRSDESLLDRLRLPEIPTLEPQQSYLRIPMPAIAKKGGGVRVKRLLMYSADGSLENGDKVLAGSEYIYETFIKEGGSEYRISSGVATNEPLQSREENSLIRLIDENDPYVATHVIAGDDVIQYEGMLGESLLPSPSVGYSRVLIRSISVNTATDDIIVNPGFSVYDFLTAKDHPTVECIASEVIHEAKPFNFLMEMLQNSEEEIRLTQGYTFMKNNVHGVTRAVHWYGGEYTLGQTNKDDAFANSYSVSAQEYEYFEPGEEVPVMYAPDRPLRMRPIGKQTDVVMEARSMVDITENMPIQWSVFIIPATPPTPLQSILSAMLYMYNKRDELYQHTTTKIIDNPILLKKVRSTSEGIVSEVENVVFDALTGSPVVIHTTDGYNGFNLEQSSSHNGGYYSYNIPAHMVDKYKNMGQYASAAGFIFHNAGSAYEWSMPDVEMTVSATPSDISNGGTSVGTCNFSIPAGSSLSAAAMLQVKNRLTRLLHTLTPGDMVELKNIRSAQSNQYIDSKYIGSKGIYYLGEVTEDISNPTNPSLSFQLFDPHFGSTPGMRPGNGVAIGDANLLEVIQSGKDNSTFASAGMVVTYGADITPAVNCARKIREREKEANNLNNWLNAANRVYYGATEEKLGDISTLDKHLFTWQSLPGTLAFNYDIINHYSIPLHPSYTTAILASDCNSLPAYLCCQQPLNLLPAARVIPHFDWQMTKKGDIGSEIISIGWWDNLTSDWVFAMTTGSPGYMKQEIAYTGKEQFGVNDDGDLVFYQYPEEQTSVPRNLNFVFRGIDEEAETVPVAMARVNAIPGSILGQVIQTAAQTYSDDWPHDFDPTNTEYNLYETGKKGRWRPDASFVYRDGAVVPGSYDEHVTSTETGSRIDERVYKNAGTFTLPALFNYTTPSASVAAGWMQPISIEKYTRHGNVEQVKDMLDLHASSRLGHGGNVQSISAAPAEASQISFDSFEDFAPGATGITNGIAHTGKYSHILNASNTYTAPSVTYGSGNILIRFWVRGATPTSTVNVSPVSTPLSPSVLVDFVSSGLSISSFSTSRIARTGEWSLYEVVVPSTSITGTGSFQLRLSASSSHTFYVDDVVVKPWLAESACYVYERNTLRPLAVLDGEHFALIYQYDGEGKLTRFIKETIKGYKTMGDGFIHIPEDKIRAALLDQGEHILSSISTGTAGKSTATSMRQRIRSQSLEQALSPQDNSWQTPMQGAEGTFDLLNLNITPDKTSLRWIGQDSNYVPKIPQLPSVKKPLGPMQMPSTDSLETFRQFAPPVKSTHPDSVQIRAVDSLKTRVNSSTGKIKKQR